MASLTSDAVNQLIYSYFKDEGLDLAAKALAADAHLDTTALQPEEQGSSALVKLILRGIESVSLESTVNAKSASPQFDFGFAQVAKWQGGEKLYSFAEPELLLVCTENKLAVMHKDGEVNTDLPGFSCLNTIHDGFVLIGQKSGAVSLLNTATNPVTVFPPQNVGSPVYTVSASPGNQMYACVCADFVATWPARLETETEESVVKTPLQSAIPQFGCLVWLDDTKLAVAQAETVLILDTAGSKRELKRHVLPVTQLVFDFDHRTLVSASLDGVVCVWTADADAPKHVIKAHEGEITGMHITGNSLVTASADGKVRMYTLETSELTAEFDAGSRIKQICVADEIAVLTETGVMKLGLDLTLKANRAVHANSIAFIGSRLAVAGDETVVLA